MLLSLDPQTGYICTLPGIRTPGAVHLSTNQANLVDGPPMDPDLDILPNWTLAELMQEWDMACYQDEPEQLELVYRPATAYG